MLKLDRMIQVKRKASSPQTYVISQNQMLILQYTIILSYQLKEKKKLNKNYIQKRQNFLQMNERILILKIKIKLIYLHCARLLIAYISYNLQLSPLEHSKTNKIHIHLQSTHVFLNLYTFDSQTVPKQTKHMSNSRAF